MFLANLAVLAVCIKCLFLPHVYCSAGDRDPLYRECVGRRADAYQCMMEITEQRLLEGRPMLQYDGHWPYRRILGMQDPASCVFSLGNAAPHIHRIISSLYRDKEQTSSYLSSWLAVFPFIHLLAWLSSALYHAHKTPFSTAMDYIFAFLLLVFSLLLLIRRAIGPYCSSAALLAMFLCVLPPAAAYSSLLLASYPLLNHTRHIFICSIIAATHTLLWIALAAHPKYLAAVSRPRAVACNLFFALAGLFEVLDFPPILLFLDAHAVWHLLTIPLAVMWYRLWDGELKHAAELHAMEGRRTE